MTYQIMLLIVHMSICKPLYKTDAFSKLTQAFITPNIFQVDKWFYIYGIPS